MPLSRKTSATRGPRRHGTLGQAIAISFLTLAACGSPPAVPELPTWADVEPILRGACVGCHGGSAAIAGSTAGATYRLDFYDMSSDVCGDAAMAMAPSRFAAAASSQIAFDITSTSPSIRPRMPPLPGPALVDWEWQTLLRWTHDPRKGTPPIGNQPPTIRITSPRRTLQTVFTLSALLEDADGDSAVGLLRVGDEISLRMDRPGAFAVDIDASQWPSGAVSVRATVCDGWGQVSRDLGSIDVGD